MAKSKLTQIDTVRAATNAPELSENTVTLGDRTFKIVDLAYDDYVKFMACLQPLFEALISKLAQTKGIAFEASELSGSMVLRYCSHSLPEMVRLCLSQTEPTITSDEIKALGKTPFRLAQVVLKQVEQNQMIQEIASFFVQMSPLLKAGLSLKP
jgi:hypothetical protein